VHSRVPTVIRSIHSDRAVDRIAQWTVIGTTYIVCVCRACGILQQTTRSLLHISAMEVALNDRVSDTIPSKAMA